MRRRGLVGAAAGPALAVAAPVRSQDGPWPSRPSRAILAAPQVQQRFETLGTPLQCLDAPESARFCERENEVLSDVVRRIGKVE